MMKVFTFIEVISKFHQYMMHGHTGDANTFAIKLGISRASLFNLINELGSYGIEIEYCRARQTYRYLHPESVQIIIKISQQQEIL